MDAANLILIRIDQREKAADKVQQLLTGYGCIIRTRIGFHETDPKECASGGLIILHLTPGAEADKLKSELSGIEGVRAGKVVF